MRRNIIVEGQMFLNELIKKRRKTQGPPAGSWDRAKQVQSGEITGEMPPDFNGPGFTGAVSTTALPGTEGKVAIMAIRAALRQPLFHPGDETLS